MKEMNERQIRAIVEFVRQITGDPEYVAITMIDGKSNEYQRVEYHCFDDGVEKIECSLSVLDE